MQQNKKIACAVLAGIAVYAFYRYSRLSDEKKAGVLIILKETGKKIVGNIVPNKIKDRLAKNDSIDNHPDYGKILI
ncbi:MAG TPA: hypothetical protein VK498_08510 [Ferruginibacter sp.]|nr:hypothetical protein [Ferruginibacter sp.]